MQLYGLQMEIDWEDTPGNLARVRQWLEREPPEPGSLVVLPEMFSTGFSMQVAAIAEPEHGPAATFLAEVARHYRVTIAGGIVRRNAEGKGLNQALVIGPDGKIGCTYTKLHPFCLGAEFEHYCRGDSLGLFDWQGVQGAIFICYDLRFPEVFRHAVCRGAEFFLVIANWPRSRENHWMTLLQARAIENQAYVIGVNRCGRDPHHAYSGRSLIVNPRGEIVADAGEEAGWLQAPFDRELIRNYRRGFPVLNDLRKEFLPSS